ncbi:MAG: tetratricopeptide repeat protein [Nitrospiraceae bacterium]
MKLIHIVLALMMVVWGLSACSSKPKAKPLIPLALATTVQGAAAGYNEQGMHAYQSGQFSDAKNYFSQAVAAAPKSGHAHYNLGLALNALGETEQAHAQFIEAANLEPGDKTIWDSPALRPFGSPETPKQAKEHPTATQRPTFGGGPR